VSTESLSWVIETFIAVTILMLLVLALRGPVATRFGARAAYLLWLAPALRMIMPPLPENWGVAPTQQIQEAVIVMTGVSSPASVAIAVPESGTLWPAAFLALWLGGAALFFLRHIMAYRHFVRTTVTETTPFDMQGAIAVSASPRVTSPLALGIITKTIIVPHDFTTRFNTTEQRLALTHELTHHRRGDPGINLLALIMLALHWFNPVAHIAHRAFRLDQEEACDAIVLNGATLCERHAYGSALFKAAIGPVPLAACAMGTVTTLKTRLRRIAQAPQPLFFTGLGTSFAAMFVIAAVFLTASNGFAAKKVEQSADTPQAIILGGGIIDSDDVRASADKTIAEAEAAVEEAERAAESASEVADKASDERWASDRERAKADVARAKADLARASADLARSSADAARAKAEITVASPIAPAPPAPPSDLEEDEARLAPPAPPASGIASKTRCPEDTDRQEIRSVQRNIGTKPQVFSMVICIPSKQAIRKNVLDGLKAARATIAAEMNLSVDQRKRALEALDSRIASLTPRP
jgi:beta-lactamase regulating signal transducer with metallopeptidase domain